MDELKQAFSKERWVQERKKGIDEVMEMIQDCMDKSYEDAAIQFATPMEELGDKSMAELVIASQTERVKDFLRGYKMARTGSNS